jgi:hypothetical protein
LDASYLEYDTLWLARGFHPGVASESLARVLSKGLRTAGSEMFRIRNQSKESPR